MLRIARIALTLLAMACSSRGSAPPEPPAPRPVAVADAAVDAADTELARRKLDGWLAVFNGGKRDEILAFRERELSDRELGLLGKWSTGVARSDGEEAIRSVDTQIRLMIYGWCG